MLNSRRDFFKLAAATGLVAALFSAKSSYAAHYEAVVSCAYCGTGFRVVWNGTDTGYGSYQCPNCHKSSRVHWGPGGVQKVERA